MKKSARTKSKQQKSQKDQKHSSDPEAEFYDKILGIDIGKPKTAVNFFFKEYFKKEGFHGSKNNIGEFSKAASSKYNKLSAKEKEKYENMAREDALRYEENLRLVKKYVVNPDKLISNQSPYLLFKDVFIYDYLKEKDVSYDEASKAAKSAWDSFNKKEKDIWKKKYEQDKETLRGIKKFKSGKVTAYMKYVNHEIEYGEKTVEEARASWKTLGNKQKDKYQIIANKENEAKEGLRDMYDIANGIKPKKPMTASTIYICEMIATGKLSKKNIISDGSKMWKELPDDQKQSYLKKQKFLQLKYQMKMICYSSFKNKDTKIRRLSGYNLYIKENSEKLKEGHPSEKAFFSLCNSEWLKLPENTRNEYNKKAELINKENAITDQTNYIKSKPKIPSNQYALFVKEQVAVLKSKKDYSSKEMSELFHKCAQIWATMPEDQKEKYKALYEESKKKYDEELVEYNKSHESKDINKGRKSRSKFFEPTKSRPNLKSKSKSESKFQIKSAGPVKPHETRVFPKARVEISEKTIEQVDIGKKKKKTVKV